MNQWTIDINEENFEAEVLARSTEVPVLVDFWAEWCGPCKVLGPVLEKLAGEYSGEFILAKVNVDENQQLAAAFGIQGIPAVKLFREGDLASEFTGALPEPMLREFLSKFLPTAADKEALAAVELEAAGNAEEAKSAYQAILADNPNHSKALLGLGRLAMNAGDTEEARNYLDQISIVDDERKEAERLLARLDLQAGGAQNEAALRERINANPKDIEARFQLAQALAGVEKYEAALAEFLAIVKADRQFKDDGARKAMVQIFEVLGSDDPLTDKYRSELAAVLFR
ncbi:MAG TPA: thioredoxin [Candidatus Limnocylindrales bacterium]|nr:thioredoxin [Candidatus Limnocylindrales bacterium]